jgi:radical SAM protein with 4Fe4S-binding SPASM domain
MQLEKMITIEVTDFCNLHCKMCSQGKSEMPHGVPKGFLSFETWINIIKGLKNFEGPNTLTPFWIGEPLLNKDFKQMMTYAFENNNNNQLFTSITINTNGALLTKEISDEFLRLASLHNQNKSTFGRIHFSIDAINPETFQKIKGSNDLKKINENIIYFLEKRRDLKLKYPNITIAFIVMEENKNEAKEFLDFWEKELKKYNEDIEIAPDWPRTKLDTIYIRRLDDWEKQEEAEKMHKEVCVDLDIVKDTEKRIIKTTSVLGFEDKIIRRPCPALWRTPIIYRNGDVSVCCIDIYMKNKIGNVNEKSLNEIWNSELLKKWRIAQIEGKFEESGPICGNCGNAFGPFLTDKYIINYLKDIKRDDLINGYLKRIKND